MTHIKADLGGGKEASIPRCQELPSIRCIIQYSNCFKLAPELKSWNVRLSRCTEYITVQKQFSTKKSPQMHRNMNSVTQKLKTPLPIFTTIFLALCSDSILALLALNLAS